MLKKTNQITKQTNVRLTGDARSKLDNLASWLNVNRSQLFESIAQGQLKVVTPEAIELLKEYLRELNALHRDELKGRGLWKKSAKHHRKEILSQKIAAIDRLLVQLTANTPAVFLEEREEALIAA